MNIVPKEGITTKKRVYAPLYYNKFNCKCGDCRHVCCGGWGIALSEREYYELIGIDCSQGLRCRLDRAFHLADHPEKDRFALISPNYEGKCPVLRDDGLCALQREKGEDILPIVCRMYPRSIKAGLPGEAVMSASCEETTELLIGDDSPLTFSEDVLFVPFEGLETSLNSAEKLALNRSCISLISDRSFSLKERLQKIGELVSGKKALTEKSGEEALFAVLRLIRSYRRTSAAIDAFADRIFPLFGCEPDVADDSDALRLFRDKQTEFQTHFPKAEIWFEKLLCNHLFYMQFPYADSRLSPEKNYTAFLVASAFLSVVLPLVLSGASSVNEFVDSVSDMFRFLEHSSLYSIGKYGVIPDGIAAYELFASLF